LADGVLQIRKIRYPVWKSEKNEKKDLPQRYEALPRDYHKAFTSGN